LCFLILCDFGNSKTFKFHKSTRVLSHQVITFQLIWRPFDVLLPNLISLSRWIVQKIHHWLDYWSFDVYLNCPKFSGLKMSLHADMYRVVIFQSTLLLRNNFRRPKIIKAMYSKKQCLETNSQNLIVTISGIIRIQFFIYRHIALWLNLPMTYLLTKQNIQQCIYFICLESPSVGDVTFP
jgi:hypothetical protein